MSDTSDFDLVSLTADITSAYVGNNKMVSGDVAGLITSIHNALHGVSQPAPSEPAKLEPAVSVRVSIKPDSITCLECGKKAKMLKRHLKAAHGLTPAEYREKWELPRDYPMVASAYAAQRATLAKTIGLGRKKVEEADEAVAVSVRATRRKLGIVAAKAAAVSHFGGDRAAPAKRGRPAKKVRPEATDTGAAFETVADQK